MKRISCAVVVLAALLFAAPDNVFAQSHSVAFRQGVGFWLVRNGIGKGSVKYPAGQHFTWNKELVYQYTSTKKWAVEVGANMYNMRRESEWWSGLTHFSKSSFSTQLELPISVQYDVTYPLLGMMFPQMVKIKSYIGFVGVPGISFENIDKSRKEDYGTVTRRSSKENDMSFIVGFVYRHHIPVTKRLAVSSILTFRMDPFHAHLRKAENMDISPNRNITFQTGLSYSLD